MACPESLISLGYVAHQKMTFSKNLVVSSWARLCRRHLRKPTWYNYSSTHPL